MIKKEKTVSAYEWGKAHKSCPVALEMRKALGLDKTQADWYLECPRGDWLLWQFLNGLTEGELRSIEGAVLRAMDKIVERAVRRYALPHPVTKSWAERWLNGEKSVVTSYAAADAAFAVDATCVDYTLAYAAYLAAQAACAAHAAHVDYVDDVANALHIPSRIMIEAARTANYAAQAAGIAANIAYTIDTVELIAQADDIRKEIPEWVWYTGIRFKGGLK